VEREKIFCGACEGMEGEMKRDKNCLNSGLGPEPRRRGGPPSRPVVEREEDIIRLRWVCCGYVKVGIRYTPEA
jgi:hypothetical protein